MEMIRNPIFLAGLLTLAATLPLMSTRVRMKLDPIKKRFITMKPNQSGFQMVEIIIVIAVLLVTTIGGMFVFNGIRNNAEKMAAEIEGGSTSKTPVHTSGSSSAPSDFIASSKAPEPVKEIAPYDPSILLNVLSVIGVLVLLAIIGYVGTLLWKKQVTIVRIANNEAEHISGIIVEAAKKVSDTLLASASYETDLAKQIEYPLMTDVTQAPVIEYIKNMKHAIFARDSLSTKPTLEMAKDYFAAANNFETTFKAAESWAVKMKWSTFSVEESRRLNDAKVSLALLEDASTSPDQRNALYKRLEKLLTGLVNITDQVKRELSTKVPMLALESVE